MKIILPGCLLFLLSYSSSASIPGSIKADTSENVIDSLPDKKAFLEKYGRDDSSRALISFYFKKRKLDKRMLYAGSILSFIGGAVVLPVMNMRDPGIYGTADYNPSNKTGFVIVTGLVLAAGIPLLIVGGSLLWRYNRKRLHRLLIDYFNGKPIPRGINRNKYFRLYLKSVGDK